MIVSLCAFRCFCHLHCKRATNIAIRIDTLRVVKCLGAHAAYCFAGAPCPDFLFSPVVGAVAHRRRRRWRRLWGRARGFWCRGRRTCGGGGGDAVCCVALPRIGPASAVSAGGRVGLRHLRCDSSCLSGFSFLRSRPFIVHHPRS